MENYHEVDIEKYYRRGPYEHFSAVKCSTSMTNRIDVTNLLNHAVADGYLIAKFFITFEKEMNEFIAKYN